MPENEPQPPSPATVAAAHASRQYTQADLDARVRDALREQREQHADYEDLKARAEEAVHAHARAAELEQEITHTRLENLRVTIASSHGVSTEDRDVLMTATDAEGLTAQARRLAALSQQRSTGGNIARKEGHVTVTPTGNEEVRAFVSDLMGSGGDWFMR
ncbi:hypothetical protein AB0N73_04060 [Microbacterium sp. NPDC089189]|uniref:hypothetical protein n=1 Tax=Microbacterium sp. NPDC089189 TaxID=3154972 RepID=UPI00342E1090